MSLKSNTLTLLRCTGIKLLLLLAAAVLDIILSALMLRFASYALTIACFAVAGVFSGVCCLSSALERMEKEQREKAARHLLAGTAAVGILLFIAIAPLSGREYSWPLRLFAVTEVGTVFFLWKNKFYEDLETPGRTKNKK